jgi:hypothetical protein
MAKDPSILAEDDAYFIGTAVRVLRSVESDLGELKDTSVFTPVVFRVEAAIRGSIPETAVVMDAGGTLPSGVGVGGEGTIGFRSGERYVVAGAANADGTYRVDACTDTGQISQADSDRLLRLAEGKQATRPTAISGDDRAAGGSNTLVILIAFLAGAGLSTALVLARRRRSADRGK